MSDLFVCYSRKDSVPVLELTERLSADGISCWIDQHQIEAATHWSRETVHALNQSDAMLLFLSNNSIRSDYVVREVTLAFEKKKRIIPIQLEPVTIPEELEYQLAGIQYVSHTNFAAIVRTVRQTTATESRLPSLTALPPDPLGRKTFAVLPFENLSPEPDNEWFADGLTQELINVTSKIRKLRVKDRRTVMEYKHSKKALPRIAYELGVEFVLEGSVRRQGNNLRIAAELIDIANDEHLWSETFKGTVEDIFDIQEQVAKKIVEGLELNITRAEKSSISQRGTANAEAYSSYLKATELFNENPLLPSETIINYLSEAIRIDPNYAEAYDFKARTLSNFFRLNDRNPHYLREAEALALKAQELNPDLWSTYGSLSDIYINQKRFKEAELAALEYVEQAPKDWRSHDCLGAYYIETNQPEKAIVPYEASVRLEPDRKDGYGSLVLALHRSGKTEERGQWSEKARPYYESWLELHPDDYYARSWLAGLLLSAGRIDATLEALAPLEGKSDLDGKTLYTIACLYIYLGAIQKALDALSRCVDAGFAFIENFRIDPDLDPVRDTPEFHEILERLEKKIGIVAGPAEIR